MGHGSGWKNEESREFHKFHDPSQRTVCLSQIHVHHILLCWLLIDCHIITHHISRSHTRRTHLITISISICHDRGEATCRNDSAVQVRI
jgi:hypothetical protein